MKLETCKVYHFLLLINKRLAKLHLLHQAGSINGMNHMLENFQHNAWMTLKMCHSMEIGIHLLIKSSLT